VEKRKAKTRYPRDIQPCTRYGATQQRSAATKYSTLTDVAANNQVITEIEGQDGLISPDSIRKDAERFGWSASVWLSKHLNGRQPALMAKTVTPTIMQSNSSRRLSERRLIASARATRQCARY
jgi:hypothetical protein